MHNIASCFPTVRYPPGRARGGARHAGGGGSRINPVSYNVGEFLLRRERHSLRHDLWRLATGHTPPPSPLTTPRHRPQPAPNSMTRS